MATSQSSPQPVNVNNDPSFNSSRLSPLPSSNPSPSLTLPLTHILDVAVVGAGIAGLQAARVLTDSFKHLRIQIFEAQDYVGGRVRTSSTFIPGRRVDLGAEILHGSRNTLTKYARIHQLELTEMYCWAHGDGGPLCHPVNGGYGLYYINNGVEKLLLRYDDPDISFTTANSLLLNLKYIDDSTIPSTLSLNDYLIVNDITDKGILAMCDAGYANTLCSTLKSLSIKQQIRWMKHWDAESGGEHNDDDDGDGEFRINNSYGCIIDLLKQNLNIQLNTPIISIKKYMNGKQPLIQLTTKNNEIILARCVIVAVPSYVLQNRMIEFVPPLPPTRQAALQCVVTNPILKIFIKFHKPCWPENLHGMIMAGDDCPIPEAWFRIYATGECYATGFVTSDYARNLMTKTDDAICLIFMQQLSHVFRLLTSHHMSADGKHNTYNTFQVNRTSNVQLKTPEEVYISGMVQRWCPASHPYIGGGYASYIPGTDINYALCLSEPLETMSVLFCGEYSHINAGATAHAAMETGTRAASQVCTILKQSTAKL